MEGQQQLELPIEVECQERPGRAVRRDRKPGPPCKACGKPVRRRPNIYCNAQCQAEYRYTQFIEQWLSGQHRFSPTGCVSVHIKRWLRKTRGDNCEECGWSRAHPKTGRAPLHVHHIDGKYSNNDPSNLRLLCPNCHSLTENYGSLNNGNGRPYHVIKNPRFDALPPEFH